MADEQTADTLVPDEESPVCPKQVGMVAIAAMTAVAQQRKTKPISDAIDSRPCLLPLAWFMAQTRTGRQRIGAARTAGSLV